MGKFTIDVPPGHSVIKSGENCYRVVDVSTDPLPKTWEEFCKTHPVKNGEAYISADSSILMGDGIRFVNAGRNYLPNKEIAEAFLALMQLIQLRDLYNGDWKPDWDNLGEFKYIIINKENHLSTSCSISVNYVLSFRTEALRDHFLACFRDLIETAKPLI